MSSNRRTQSITFRLPHDVCEAVDVLAGAQGISRGHWIRGQIISAVSRLDKNDVTAVLNDLVESNNALDERFEDLEKVFIRHLYYTLIYAGAVDPEVAESVAREKLFPEGRNVS